MFIDYSVFVVMVICLDRKFYTVSMKLPTGRTIKLSVHWPYTVESIKRMISKKEDISARYQQLTFDGRVLEDGHVLTDESSLDLMVTYGCEFMCCLLVDHAVTCGS